jgi:transcriptional regulator with GAF, ATPase, and Fis domain
MELLLDVWREACRHLAVEDAFERIAELVGPRIPADLLVVRRVDAERRRIETVPAGQGEREGRPSVERTECSAQQLDELLRWARRGTMLRCGPPAKHPLAQVMAPRGIWGDVIAGPLLDDERLIGLLVAAVASPRQFTADHEALLRRLLEPCAMALVNDARWHELVRLREASEADRRALLSRLERDTIADTIVGADAGLRQVMERVEQVAPTDAPVLLLGETGTGKEVIARAIHARSRRAGGPVVRVNCGAIPPGLIDSELFGHVRGSFTGAVAERKGWFERADGGTLFLDEVAELPLDAQVRLLRILQDGTYERVGGQRTLQVDVRIVAATHRDLRERVADGSFREDLWYRIGVFPIRLPALRDRLEDLPALAAHFAWRAGMRLSGHPLAPTQHDIELLVEYPWPGNVREVATVIERAAILGDGKTLDIRRALGGPPEPADHGAPVAPAPPEDIVPLDDAIRRHIVQALRATAGRVEGSRGAAALLEVNPHTLRARMRKLKIDWARFRAG